MKLTLRNKIKYIALRIIYWRPYNTGKILLCRPIGGLNDMLTQIQECREYAIKSNRRLWVDASRSGFHDCLSNYFEPHKDFSFGSPNGSFLANNSVFPRFLDGKLNSYGSFYDTSVKKVVDEETGYPLTFDFNSYYSESILLHEQQGGRPVAIRTLAVLQLKPVIRRKIKDIIDNLGEYDAIHVRNTDLTTDYRRFFENVNDAIRERVVVCTDDLQCMNYSEYFWGDKLSVVHSIPDTGGKPLHRTKFSRSDRYTVNVDVVTDLLVLASARTFYKCRTNEGRVSGFAKLVESLRSNPKIIKKLLNGK